MSSGISRETISQTQNDGHSGPANILLLLQVTTTNPLESYHSELKQATSPSFGLIGACHKVVELDIKKRSDSEIAAFKFRVKKLSVAGVDDPLPLFA